MQAKDKFGRLPLGLVPVDAQELQSILEAADARAGVQGVKQQDQETVEAGMHVQVRSSRSPCGSVTSSHVHAVLLYGLRNQLHVPGMD